ncbi:13981_t:CDS:2 [Gigaspora margarita]|uniref:13981_t:CDS:1 n=1 Tax=Gigaspora margarita TaxID=4874 RepID=A0ABN7UXQ4_GIGMA|nr:13981_t:CDS:2 [Gigaspora margarita]
MDHIDINDIKANIEEPNYVDINYTEANMEENRLYEGKKFSSWNICDLFLDKWSRSRGFKIIKDHVFKDGNIVRRRSYICEHGKRYKSKSKKKMFTKKISCPWHLNVSCSSNDSEITVNTIVNEHNHELNKIFNQDILDDIKFMTEHCNMGATAQRKFLEGKYPLQSIYSKNLYAAIRKFRPTKALLNDAATMSNWIDEQKKEDSRWIVARDWDDDNTLTRLFWMTPSQVENWIQYRLLIDETHESHVWLFNEIIKATGIEPAVILTDSDPAVDSAVKKVLKSTLVKATFENRFTKLVYDYSRAKPYLDNLYRSKKYWAYSFTSFKFTGGMIATSRVEATNACLKKFLHNSNISLNELMQEIHHMLDRQDKESEFLFWKLMIPSIKSNDYTNFLFTRIDKSCQTYLTPNMLKMQRDKIDQLVYYSAQIISIESLKSINKDDIMINIEEENPEDQQATIQQMFEVVEKDFLQENLSLLEQKLIYGTLHGTYKKAISKALQSKSESDRLLKLLEDFVQERDQSEDSFSDNNHSDESTSKKEFQLKNPKH